MKKEELKAKLEEAGDAVITYRSQNSRKLKYNVCTSDFSTEYIRRKEIEQRKVNTQFYYFAGIQILIEYLCQKMLRVSYLSTE